MQKECPNFVPNLWKPLLCSNCLQTHPSSSAPPSPSVGNNRVGLSLPRLQIPSSAPSTPSHPSSSSSLSSTPPKSHQPARVLEHKRSNSTPGTSSTPAIAAAKRNNSKFSTPLNTGPLPRRTNINVLTHSESAKRKKDETNSGACDSFSPQRWRPSVCMFF